MHCEKCGKPLSGTAFCENCGYTNPQPSAQPQTVNTPDVSKPENVLTGFVGALIGSALGAGAIILLSQLGYIASVSGFILAICTFKGYELLGGKLSTKGLIICLALIIVVPYLADRLDWAILITNELPGISLGEAFEVAPDLADSDSYTENLVKLYLFVALGAGSTIFGAFKKKK